MEILNLGQISYEKAWDIQKSLVDKRIQDEIPDQLIICEHTPAVITLGRGAQRGGTIDFAAAGIFPQLLEAQNIQCIPVERGGLATYHGPGQIVLYPIFKMGKKESGAGRNGVVDLIRHLEILVIHYLKKKNLNAGTVADKTGVWIDESRKIASIGIAARHWVSYHGLAMNISTGPTPWKLLNPCGLGQVMTDLQTETAKQYSFSDVAKELSTEAMNLFGS